MTAMIIAAASLTWSADTQANRDRMIRAIWHVEASGRLNPPDGADGDVGPLQITPIRLADVNRIVGFEKYSLDDRRDLAKSIEMFWISARHYCRHHGDYSPETIARMWRYGTTRERINAPTATRYWRKVRKELLRAQEADQK